MDEIELQDWQTGWFWMNAYEPSAGFANLARGPLGEVIATITVQVWDGLAEIFYLRYDPPRQSIDLIARMDPEFPWSLESSVKVSNSDAEDLDEAASTWGCDPDSLFELMITLNNGLEIGSLHDADANGWVPADIKANLIGQDVWATSRPSFDRQTAIEASAD